MAWSLVSTFGITFRGSFIVPVANVFDQIHADRDWQFFAVICRIEWLCHSSLDFFWLFNDKFVEIVLFLSENQPDARFLSFRQLTRMQGLLVYCCLYYLRVCSQSNTLGRKKEREREREREREEGSLFFSLISEINYSLQFDKLPTKPKCCTRPFYSGEPRSNRDSCVAS